MHLIPRFLWKRLNPEIIVSKGRAICYECGKELYGEVCQVSNSSRYYCRKHAKKQLKKIEDKIEEKNIEIEEVKSVPKKKVKEKLIISAEFTGYCDYCHKKIGGVDVFNCKYCGHHHCSEHRIPEEHGCPSKTRAILKKKGNIIYR